MLPGGPFPFDHRSLLRYSVVSRAPNVPTMSPDPTRAKEIAESALNMPPTRRDSFVDDSCGGDDALRSAVDDLMDAATRPTRDDQDMTRHGGSVGPQFDQDDFIGPYRVIQKLGDGGFGEVYQARQSEPIRRDVAVKVLKRGMDSRQVLGRFQAERRAQQRELVRPAGGRAG